MTVAHRTIIRATATLMVAGLPFIVAALETAQAQRASSAGVLRCKFVGGGSYVVGSSRKLSCIYRPNRGKPERYVGKMNRIGVDLGRVKSGSITWHVFAPGSGREGRGRLAGTYAGYGGQIAVGKGLGYQNLIGGVGNIMLNPTSVTGLSGLNVAYGIQGLTLRYAR